MPSNQAADGVFGIALSGSASLPAGAQVVRLVAHEALSEPYKIELLLDIDDHSLDPDSLLGETIGVHCQLRSGAGGSQAPVEDLEFTGYVAEFEYVPPEMDKALYRAVLRPGLWFLTRSADCRIFQELTAQEIVAQVLGDHADLVTIQDNSPAGDFRVREYCVQYRETSFAFVSRLMEDEGVSYSFSHNSQAATHTMVMDRQGVHETNTTSLEFWDHLDARKSEPHFANWRNAGELTTGSYTLRDFEFTTPSTDLTVALQSDRGHAHADLEVYDYPGGYTVAAEGDHYVANRKERGDTGYRTVRGVTAVPGMRPGVQRTLTGLPVGDGNYLLTRATHHLQVGGPGGGGDDYRCEFEAIKAEAPYRPRRVTPKPFVRGPQTAKVVGPSGEEIYTDDDGYGRVKVQFHWDREGGNDENSSCWVRVAQLWAGAGWGAQFLPRIGHEVVVSFLEGDPDRPLITGSVYNADNMPPYALPTNKTQSGIKSRSSLDGNDETFNELRFEDKMGEEEVYFHAEKNFKRVVENNDELEVGLEKCDPGDQTITVYNDQNVTVQQGNQTITVETGNQAITVQSGNHTLNIDTGTSVTEAAQSIELKVGSNSILIDNSGITLTAPMITLDASGIVDIKGSGMVKIQGGLVKIN